MTVKEFHILAGELNKYWKSFKVKFFKIEVAWFSILNPQILILEQEIVKKEKSEYNN